MEKLKKAFGQKHWKVWLAAWGMFLLLGCSTESPLQSGTQDVITLNDLVKDSAAAGGESESSEQSRTGYPQETSLTLNYSRQTKSYDGGTIETPDGTRMQWEAGSFIPPAGLLPAQELKVSMRIDVLTGCKALLYTFGPTGEKLVHPAKMWLNWNNLDPVSEFTEPCEVKLYYLDKNNFLLEQKPEFIDYTGKKMFAKIEYAARYVLAVYR